MKRFFSVAQAGMYLAVILLSGRLAFAQTNIVPLPTASQAVIDVKKDCDAKGDGTTNDTAAFRKAAKLLQEKGGGTLIIPRGTYIVGEQVHKEGEYPYYQSAPVFSVKDLNGFLIEGNGAVLRLAPGLRFGSFDKDTGEPYQPQMPFYDSKYASGNISMLSIVTSNNVTIRNLELNGNSPNLVVGGAWGDVGRQIAAHGLVLYNNSHVHLDKIHAHHHACDGIMIGYSGLKEGDPATPVTITDTVSEYNARQGLSWVGGRGMKVYRSKFNHTGRALNNGQPLGSAPGAGLDIEAEESVAREGYFEDCEFINNSGAGMVADSGDGGYTTFKNCTFWGTTNWSAWNNKPGLKFEDSRFYGSVVHAVGHSKPELATQWINCVFEDKPWTDGKVYRANSTGYLLELNGNLENVMLKDCDFIANTGRSIWASASSAGRITFSGCSFLHKKSDLSDKNFQALFRNANFIGGHFKEEFGADTSANWHIANENVTVAAQPPIVVDGPRVTWGGRTGIISPTP